MLFPGLGGYIYIIQLSDPAGSDLYNSCPIRLVPTYIILPAKDIRLLVYKRKKTFGKVWPESFKTERLVCMIALKLRD